MIAADCVPPVRLINRVLKMIGRVDRHFNIELLKESPSPAIRTCTTLAQLQVLPLQHPHTYQDTLISKK